MTNLADSIRSAPQQLFDRPIVGPLSAAIWGALNLVPIEELVLGGLTEKAELTRCDHQQHSFLLMIPVPDAPQAVMLGMTWPQPLSEARGEAMRQFFQAAAQYAKGPDVSGMAQLDVFLEADGAVDLRLAWLPAGATERLPAPLRNALMPWGTEPRGGDDSGIAPPTGSDIVGLAEIAWDLARAIRERLTSWPDEHGRASPDFDEIRDRCTARVEKFNAAAKAIGLGHEMPISRFDDTWLPHNLANALRFKSLPASLKSDLWRVWGPEASDRFARAWALLEDAQPGTQPDEALAQLRDAPLEIRSSSTPEVEPKPVDVFVSYAWSDKTRGARDIYEWMRLSGLSAWLDEEERLGDAVLDDGITAAMLHSKCIVICMSMEMIIRGGYALREVLLAISSVPSRCVIARLDRAPIPSICAGLPIVDWCESGGPDDLLVALQARLAGGVGSTPGPLELTLSHPLIDGLIAPLSGRESLRRVLDSSDRGRELKLRARLFDATSRVARLYDERRMEDLVAVAEETTDLMPWSDLGGSASQGDPTIFGASLRVRASLFHAHVHLGSGTNWEHHNAEAYALLEQILTVAPDLLRPAPECGWHPSDCRLSTQDCLDVLQLAKEWFRGWSPQMLVDMCGVPGKLAGSVESRIASRMALLVDRMLGLRAWEERGEVPASVPRWVNTRYSLRKNLAGKLESGGYPAVKAYFEELGRCLNPAVVDELAVAMADGVVESGLAAAGYREELSFDRSTFRVRCVIRAARSLESKRASLASVRGTVLDDLHRGGSEADLNILFWIFTEPGPSDDDWKYGLYMNCAPAVQPTGAGRLPPILMNPYLMREMLTDAEFSQLYVAGGFDIYEEA